MGTVRLQLEIEIRPVTRRDLPTLEWHGLFWAHRALIAEAFARQQRGEVLMLMADHRGEAAGQVWLDFVRRRKDRIAVLWALRVHPLLRGLGLGRELVHTAEECARERGFDRVELEVEPNNVRARRLYQRLGYEPGGTTTARMSWERPDGVVERATQQHLLLRKPLRQ